MNPTREELGAYIDGELALAERERIAAAISGSQELQGYIHEQERLLENLHAAFSTVMEQTVPERLVNAARLAPVSLRVRASELLASITAGPSGSVLRFAVPATALALGLFIGISIERRAGGDAEFAASQATGQIVAQADLASVLDHQLASDQIQTAAAQIGVSFRSKAGDDCRTFHLAHGGIDGLACHTQGEWRIAALVSGSKQTGSADYQLAGSEMPEAIRNAVASQIAGDPFDAAAERSARDKGWH